MRSLADLTKLVDQVVKRTLIVKADGVKGADVAEYSTVLCFRGVVQTSLGDPYPGAKVLAIDEETWQIVGEAVSDVNGEWEMYLPGGKRYTFVAVAPELDVGGDAKPHVSG